jgi:phage host-nuclease inhibitor protein Gam
MRKVLYNTKAIDEMTLGQLIDMVNDFAPRRAKILAALAEMDQRIADFKAREQAKFDELLGTMAADTDTEEREIAMIIMAHKEWFDKPRAQKTAVAEFGLRKSPDSVKISDNEAVIAYSDKNGLELYANQPVISKDAVLRMLKEGKNVPGASLQGGEKAFVKVKMDNLDLELNPTK